MSFSLIARRAMQLGFVAVLAYSALSGPWRNYKRAHNLERIVTLIHGEVVGFAYGLNEDILSIAGDPAEISKGFLAMPWSIRIFGINFADPMLALTQLVQKATLDTGVLWPVLPVLVLAIVMGRFFCSHVCPMRLLFEFGQAIRRGLNRLGVELPYLNPALSPRFGGYVLIGGLVGASVSSTAVWFLILPYLSISLSLFVFLSTGIVSGTIVVVVFWFFVDVVLFPGYFCHNLCPTGFALEQLGRFSLWRVHKDDQVSCPSNCQQCVLSCPYSLSPRDNTHRPACDNCGSCVVACPQNKLSRRVERPSRGLRIVKYGGGALVLIVLFLSSTASAHHNKGLPHYGYYENYPQVPTEENVVLQGRWEFGATVFNFQGMERQQSDTPDDVKIYAYIYDTKTDTGYKGPVHFEIHRNGIVVSTFDRKRVDEESVYSTRETVPETGTYELLAMLKLGESFGGDVVLKLPFFVDLNDGPNMLLVGLMIFPLVGLFAVALYGQKKTKRRGAKIGKRKD